MNKIDIINAPVVSINLTRTESENVVNLFFNEMTNALAKGERVEIRGFCTFHLKEYGSYIGRNPKTGQRVSIKPKKMPFFNIGKQLKERINR